MPPVKVPVSGSRTDLALASAAVIVLAASFVLSPDILPPFEICLFKLSTGRPCAGCGLTRAFCAIARGEFGRAWTYHPFSFALYGLTVALAAAPLGRLRAGGPARWLHSRGAVVGLVALAAMILLFGVWRMTRSGGMGP